MSDIKTTWFYIVFACSVSAALGKVNWTLNNEARLLKDVLEDYNPNVRPVLRQNGTVTVTIGISLHHIIDLNMKNQILISNIWIRQVWYNPLIVWEPSEYGNITAINVNPQRLWKPDLVLYNNANDNSDGALYKFETDIIVYFTGENMWLASAVFKSTCKINVAFFPFDEQICSLKIGSWTMDGFRLNLLPESDQAETDKFLSNGEWNLLEVKAQRNVLFYVCCKEPYPDVTFKIKIHRRALFYYVNILVPCFLITGVNFLSFILPPESGERITLVITSLLTMTVFMLLVADIMPPVSDVVPIISIYYVSAMFVVGLSMAATCIVLRCYFSTPDRKSMPLLLHFFIFHILARIVRVQETFGEDIQTRNNGTEDTVLLRKKHGALKKKQLGKLQEDAVARNVSTIANIIEEKKNMEKKQVEWQKAALILDKFFFWVFILVSVVTTLAVLLHARAMQTNKRVSLT